MHKLAKLSEDDRRRLIGDFLDTAFGGLDAHPEFVGTMRSLTPELPDNPEAEQVEAWVELAELSQDPDFAPACGAWPSTMPPTVPTAPPLSHAATLSPRSVTRPAQPW